MYVPLLQRSWRCAIDDAMKGPGKVWMLEKRFGSFAPIRRNCSATWSVIINMYRHSNS